MLIWFTSVAKRFRGVNPHLIKDSIICGLGRCLAVVASKGVSFFDFLTKHVPVQRFLLLCRSSTDG